MHPIAPNGKLHHIFIDPSIHILVLSLKVLASPQYLMGKLMSVADFFSLLLEDFGVSISVLAVYAVMAWQFAMHWPFAAMPHV